MKGILRFTGSCQKGESISMTKIAPSLLSADFSSMGAAAEQLKVWNADWVHLDIMDGHFVPNITFGPTMCKAIRPHTDLFLDVHLMVDQPSFWITPFAEAGADLISFHLEAETHVNRVLQQIREHGIRSGIVLNPATPASLATEVLPYCDLVLVMSVNPGFGGQKFIPECLRKIEQLRSYIDQNSLSCLIEVDGGVNLETGKRCIDAGADVLVAGNAVFHSENPAETIRLLREG